MSSQSPATKRDGTRSHHRINPLQRRSPRKIERRETACLSGMLRNETESFTSRRPRAHDSGMKKLTTWKQRSEETSRGRLGEFRFEGGNSTFFGEWQEHGPETLPGYGVRKLRLVFGPPQSVVTAG